MSQQNIDPTRNEPLPGTGAPFLYTQGDEPPGGGGGLRSNITDTEDDVDAYGEKLPPVDDSSSTTTTEPAPDSSSTAIGDEPPGGGGGVKTS